MIFRGLSTLSDVSICSSAPVSVRRNNPLRRSAVRASAWPARWSCVVYPASVYFRSVGEKVVGLTDGQLSLPGPYMPAGRLNTWRAVPQPQQCLIGLAGE